MSEKSMVQIGTLDMAIVVVYLILMVMVGIFFARRVRNTDDFYVAGRSLGLFVLMATVCATTSAYTGNIQRVGERYNIRSIPELFGMRFGKAAKCILSTMVAFSMMGTVAAQVTATATVIRLLGGGIPYEVGALIATLIFLIYMAASGMLGVIYTDVIQFAVLVLFVYIMIPTAGLTARKYVPQSNGLEEPQMYEVLSVLPSPLRHRRWI